MTNIEDLVRATQARQADRAVPTERIRSALPTRVAHAHRQRRIGMLGAVVAAAAVATAITVPALTMRPTVADRTGAQGQEPAATGTAASSPPSAAAAPQLPEFRLGYRPTWAPPGFAEHIRAADVGAPADAAGSTVTRVWKKRVGAGDPWGGAELTLSVSTEVADPASAMDTGGQPVDIHGDRGYYSGAHGDHKSYVDWSPGAHTVLILSAHHLDISRQDLVRMARSVQPEAGTVAVPVRLRWLPAGWTASGITVSGPSAATWRGQVTAGSIAPEPTTIAEHKAAKEGAASGPGSLSVEVGTGTDAPAGGETLTVGGHPARHPVRADEPGKTLTYLVVDLGKGRLLTLIGQGGGITLNDLAKIAANVEITPAGLGWLD
jgi:hypothetical protein